MIISYRFLFSIGLILSLAAAAACGKGGRYFPMKVNARIDIPDGEYLHYAGYYGGEKVNDCYYITRKIAGRSGKIFYMTYLDIVPVSEKAKPPVNYKRWPIFFVFDPGIGSVIESEGDLKPGAAKNWTKGGYWHYRMDPEKGEVEYIHGYQADKKINESTYIVKFDTSVPSMDMWGMQLFLCAFLTPGMAVFAIPLFRRP